MRFFYSESGILCGKTLDINGGMCYDKIDEEELGCERSISGSTGPQKEINPAQLPAALLSEF